MSSKDKDNDKDKDKEKETGPLATVGEVFSFAETTQVKLYIVCGLASAVVSGCVMPAMAFLFSSSFEQLTASVDSDVFLKDIRSLVYNFMSLGVVAFTFMTLQATFLECAAEEMSQAFKKNWFEAVARQDMAYYDLLDVSGTATIISINGAKYHNGVGRKLAQGIQFGFTFIGGLVFGFWSSWQVSLLVLLVTPLMALSTSFLLKMNQSQTSRANASYSKAGSIVFTSVSSIRTVLSLNAVESMIEKFTAATQDAYIGAQSQVVWVGLGSGAVMGSFLLAYIPVTLYGSYLLYQNIEFSGCDPSGAVPDNQKCIPAAIGVFGALMGVTFAGAVIPQVSGTIETFTAARSACYPALLAISRKTDSKNMKKGDNYEEESDHDEGEMEDIAKLQALQRRGSSVKLPKYVIDSSSTRGLRLDKVRGAIEFENVTFCYPTRLEVPVLNNFSLTVQAGKTVALVGSSGSGKSTTIHLIERFYDPKYGRVTLDGMDLKELNVKWLRQQMGLVSQEPKLFATTIRENIAMGYAGDSPPTDEQIEEAARKANAHDFIVSFPQGYDTHAGDQGTQLSGGQKQRIAIARVLINKPKLILLDEATSALDSESEAVVQEALDKLIEDGNQTIIVIAHRLSTVRNADMIAVVDKGQVVETGAHDELIAKKGYYYNLIEAQKGGKKKRDGVERSESFNSASEGSASNPPSRRSSMEDSESRGSEENLREDGMEVVPLDEQQPRQPTKEKLMDSDDTPVLRFRNVHFHYPSRPENKVFRGLNLSVREGETLAIVGPSGQGKSTIIQLIENFYRPTDGRIEFYGVDMKDINVKHLRSKLGLVSQEPFLFDDSIKENIRFGFPNATQEDIETAAKQANAHNFIMQFPDRYDTQVGSGSSSQVSGGQKQRIAIARALLRKPKILLLDEATSALDSESERIVQDALDKIMADKTQTTIVIAHRLSTVRDADRIAVIDHGKVREIGSHDELMAKKDGKYRRLHDYQNLDINTDRSELLKKEKKADVDKDQANEGEDVEPEEIDETAEDAKKHEKQAKLLASGDTLYFSIGSVGAVLAGLMFPGWGFVFAYLIQLLYVPVFFCDDLDYPPPEGFSSCPDYWESVADDMRALSFKVFYGILAIMFSACCGHVLLFYGFGTATERMNKRVRDAAFKSLIRQEVAWFDVRPIGVITTKLSDDAALIHSFSGEPIRTLVMNVASVFVGLAVSLYFMWPFALVTLGLMPFMAFGAAAEMKMYMGGDEGDLDQEPDANSPGGIVVETLQNIRTVASMTIEQQKVQQYSDALRKEVPHPFRTNFVKGSTSGLGQFVQMWGISLMMWWGGYLLLNYPKQFGFRDFMISMFSLLLSLNGMGFAMQGATDRGKAKAAAARVFDLIDRKSLIDPLSEEGRKDVGNSASF